MGKSTWRVLLAFITTMAVFIDVSAAAADDGLDDFVATYQCSLAGLIAKIHAHHSKPGEKGRFVVLALPVQTGSYVQCAFDRLDHEGLCEASSGWWDTRYKLHFSSAQLSALARLGFSTNGSHGNFPQQMHFPADGPDPYALANLMLSTLYEGYGAHKEMRIEVVAPFALRHGFLPQQRCVPIS
jgi:hypothetical protein